MRALRKELPGAEWTPTRLYSGLPTAFLVFTHKPETIHMRACRFESPAGVPAIRQGRRDTRL